tara:strand:- start:228 stop:401 length:174 start_codon:yes stop_codon:yes gene_type:complete
MNICKYIFSFFFKKEEELLNKSKDSNLSLSSQETVVTTKIIDANEKIIYSKYNTNFE